MENFKYALRLSTQKGQKIQFLKQMAWLPFNTYVATETFKQALLLDIQPVCPISV